MYNKLFSLKEMFLNADFKSFEVMKKMPYLLYKSQCNKVSWDDTSEDISSKIFLFT